MFGIPANTPVKILRPGMHWFSENLCDFVTRQFKVFDTHELVIDPSGVRRACALPAGLTLAGSVHDLGWYGFLDGSNGWGMLVKPEYLEYDGQPLIPQRPTATLDRPEVGERNGLVNGATYHAERSRDGIPQRISWATPGLRVTRLRLLSDPGFGAWDVSYCHGTFAGQHVDVELPFSQLAKDRSISSQIVRYAVRDGVFAKKIGILDAISTLN